MSKTHFTRKELKQDVVHEAGESILEYLDLHRNKIMTIILALVIFFSVVSLWSRSAKAKAHARINLLSEIENEFQAAAQTVDDPEKPEGVDNPTEPVAETRSDLLKKTIARCEEFISDHSSSQAAHEALYIKGDALALLDNYEQARADYENYLKNAKTDEEKAKANIAIGYAYENQFFDEQTKPEWRDKAAGAFQAALKTSAAPSGRLTYNGRLALVSLARISEQQKDWAKAKEFYEKILAEPIAGSDEKSDDTEEGVKSQNDLRVEQIRVGMKAATQQFSLRKIAERRLKQAEAHL